MHMSTCRRAPATSVEPVLAKAPLPPKVMVPSVRVEMRRPERPSWRYCMGSVPRWTEAGRGPEGGCRPGLRSAYLVARPRAQAQHVDDGQEGHQADDEKRDPE